MIELTDFKVFNFEGAVRGARNPLESWDKTDSYFKYHNNNINTYDYIIGDNDLLLLQKLIIAGTDHSKFMRQILITININAPLYWWKEMDTYKVATVANSCSTMHKLASTPITEKLFSFDKEMKGSFGKETRGNFENFDNYYIKKIIGILEILRTNYNETGDKKYWRALVQLLPCAWNQMRTWTANYATLRNIYFARKNHKLIEWRFFCNFIEKLPYGMELIAYVK